jgi:hypothetical protein|tara:strand:- start:10 stop:147 length:138 start_codon:yes stop_codon:yes gene_type:complete
MMDAMEIDSQYEASTMRSQHLSSPTPPSEELRQRRLLLLSWRGVE